MSKEKWVPVPGFETRYMISSKGNVKTKSRQLYAPDGSLITNIEERSVPLRETPEGSKYVILHDGKKYHKVSILDIYKEVFH